MASKTPSYEYDPKGMIFRRLGNSGLRVPIVSLGFWLTVGNTVSGEVGKALVKAAFEAGINMFDTAEGYANGVSEIELGRAIRELGYRRSDLIISTKIFYGVGRKGPNDTGLSRKHVIEGALQSLERLQMDYVDIIFAHCPDEDVPMFEVVHAFNWIINEGKAFYWGTSGWSAVQIEEAHHIAAQYHLIPPVTEQCNYNAFKRIQMEQEYRHVFSRYKYGTTTFQSLNSGYLTGKYNEFSIPEGSRLDTNRSDKDISKTVQELTSPVGKAKIEIVRKLGKIAEGEYGCSTAALAIAWVARNPNTSSVILGATKTEQVLANLEALKVLPKITEEKYAELNALFDTYEYPK